MYLLTEAYARNIAVTKSDNIVKLLNEVIDHIIRVEHIDKDQYSFYHQTQDSIKNRTPLCIEEDCYGVIFNWTDNLFFAWSNSNYNYDMKIVSLKNVRSI